MSIERRRLIVRGVVQGVGFRPFVYRTAVGLGLTGSVRNRGDAGVEIQIEGDPAAVARFIDALQSDPPPLADVGSVEVSPETPTGARSFEILPSTDAGGGSGALPPDVAICDGCLADLFGRSRYQGYWATSCTDCGPRFTVIEGVPYDRPRTSMRDFPMCDACAAEYTDPLDRRYHAQTIACATCGPVLSFDGSTEAPIERSVDALRAGGIVAVKGIGGAHLACDAFDDEAVARLRERLGRPGQPFAVMVADDGVDRIADVDEAERDALRRPERPIVIVRRRHGRLSEAVAPGLHTVGLMLPYSGLHHLLLAGLERPLVMTSANRPGRPMWIDNHSITERLTGICDHALLHDRRIVARCDDSVVRRSGGKTVFLRRSRGFVPGPIPVDLGSAPIAALGPETDLTFALYVRGEATLSQHIGSVDDVETFEFLQSAIDHLRRIRRMPDPERIASDMHPQFLTTGLAARWAAACGAEHVRVQHHAAHLLSVMAEHEIEAVVGIVLDGFGYGPDGAAWGGEVLVADRTRVERVGSLRAVRLPGGDLAARYPLRMAAALLHAAGESPAAIRKGLVRRGMGAESADAVLAQIRRGVNAPWTTSAGRFLDAVAAWLGICTERTYEGEPAMRLEAAAARGRDEPLEIEFGWEDGRRVLEVPTIFRRLIDRRRSMADLAATAQRALAEGVARIALDAAAERGIDTVAFTGGVAVNDAMASAVRRAVEGAGARYRTNERVPCGDGGVSLGQAAAAGWGTRGLVTDGADAAAGQSEEDGAEHQEDCGLEHGGRF